MTWLNRGFKLRHKFIKEKDMKEEAIRALEQFKQLHLAREVDGQADMVSESPEPTKEQNMEQRKIDIESLRYPPRVTDAPEQPKKSINYPDHIAPLKQRIMSALKNGARTVESVARYCKEEEKLINLQLNRWVSRGMIGKHITPSSGIVRYYPEDISREMGILTAPQPINRKPKKAKQEQKRSSYAPATQEPKSRVEIKETQYIAFLEKRVTEWQAESRKQAHEILELRDEANKLRNALSKAMERHGVAEEVTQLRATVEYLESKLFGSK